MLLLLLRYFSFILIAKLHPFHVSVCEVYYNPETESFEISMKIFIDDLELALQKKGATDFTLVNSSDKNKIEKELENYLSLQFKLNVNEDIIPLEFLGYEIKRDAVLCYFESDRVKIIKLVEIENAVISDLYDDQTNLTHFQYNDQMKSLRATKENLIGTIDTSSW